MKKNLLLTLLSLSVVAAINVAHAAPKTHTVQMLNAKNGKTMLFSPGFIKANLGDKVIFKPTDLGHNSQSAFTPSGANTWKGEMNKAVTVTLSKEGIYIYECLPHAMMAMVGVIQVGKAKNLNKANAFLETYKKKIVMNKNRLDSYIKKVK